jgi:hypothetical protein
LGSSSSALSHRRAPHLRRNIRRGRSASWSALPPAGRPISWRGLLADGLRRPLGQTVFVENRTGANGALGAEYVAKAEADGYTLYFTTAGVAAVYPHLRPMTRSGISPRSASSRSTRPCWW